MFKVIQTVQSGGLLVWQAKKKVEALECSTGKAAVAPAAVAVQHSFADGLKRCLATRFWNLQIPAFLGYGTHKKAMSVTAKTIILKVFTSETISCSTFLMNWHKRISSMTVDFTIPMVWWDRYFCSACGCSLLGWAVTKRMPLLWTFAQNSCLCFWGAYDWYQTFLFNESLVFWPFPLVLVSHGHSIFFFTTPIFTTLWNGLTKLPFHLCTTSQ